LRLKSDKVGVKRRNHWLKRNPKKPDKTETVYVIPKLQAYMDENYG